MGWTNMLYKPGGKEENLIPLVVRSAKEHNETKVNRYTGFSSCCQITLCIDGEGSFTDHNYSSHKIKKGDMFFVTPESMHRYEPVKEPWQVQYIVSSGYGINSILESLNLPKSGVIHLDDDILQEVHRLMTTIINVYDSEKVSKHIEASAYLYKLFVLISECGSYGVDREESRQKLAQALLYINEHFDDENLSSEQIADVAGISCSKLNRLFKSAYGMSPHKFVTDIRIEHAQYILCREKNKTVQEVAEKCGFRTSGYFIKVFKSKKGITPNEFRSRNMFSF